VKVAVFQLRRKRRARVWVLLVLDGPFVGMMLSPGFERAIAGPVLNIGASGSARASESTTRSARRAV